MTHLKFLLQQHRLMAPADDQPAGGGESTPATPASQPASGEPAASSVGEGELEVEDPVVDEFLESKPPAEDPPAAAAPTEATPAAAPATPPAAAAPAAPTPPASTPTPAPAAAAPAVAIPPAQPVTPPVVQPPAPATPPPAAATPPAPPPAVSAEDQEKQRLERRSAYLSKMETEFQIPKEEHEALLTNPEAVLPKLAARVHTAAVEATLAAVTANIEPLVLAVLERQKSYSKAEEEFYGMWPDLAKHPEGKATSSRLMQAYMAANRGISREQLMKDVGVMAMAQLRIPLQIPGAAAAAAPAAPTMAAPPPPAQPGAAGGTPRVTEPSPWDKVDQELFQE